MFFRDVIGQEEVKARLIKSVAGQRVSHAQLFSGPEGSGKLALAIAYAQYLSCRNRTGTDSCGACPSCHKYQKLAHPDLHFVFPVFKTKEVKDNPVSDDFIQKWREFVLQDAYFNLNQWLGFINVENAQGMIYERESESILRKLSLKPFESEFKVMIIWLPEKMNPSCSNKLLKMIEEPPNKTLFILITESEENIISTIRSRAQLVTIPALNDETLAQTLLKQGTDEAIVDEVVHLSSGNIIKARNYLNPDEESRYNFLKFQEMMRLAYKKEISGLIKWADEMAGTGRERQKGFFETALRLAREFFILNIKNQDMVYLNKEETDWGKNFSPFINERNIIQISGEFEKAFQHISMNGNPRIIFLDLAFQVAKLIKK